MRDLVYHRDLVFKAAMRVCQCHGKLKDIYKSKELWRCSESQLASIHAVNPGSTTWSRCSKQSLSWSTRMQSALEALYQDLSIQSQLSSPPWTFSHSIHTLFRNKIFPFKASWIGGQRQTNCSKLPIDHGTHNPLLAICWNLTILNIVTSANTVSRIDVAPAPQQRLFQLRSFTTMIQDILLATILASISVSQRQGAIFEFSACVTALYRSCQVVQPVGRLNPRVV